MKGFFDLRLILAFVSISVSSCIGTRLVDNDKLYQVTKRPGDTNPTIQCYKVNGFKKVSSVEETGKIIKVTIPKDDVETFKKGLSSLYPPNVEIKNDELTGRGIIDRKENTFYFYNDPLDDPNLKDNKMKEKRNFKFIEQKFGIQGMAIPLKFRGKIDHPSLPATVENNFNIGLALAHKTTLNVYRGSKNFLGKTTTQWSFTPGAGFGFGSTTLDPASTAPGISAKRNAGMFSLGLFAMLGINNINFGYAIGWDYAMGEGRKEWVYGGKMWQGITIALDIVKF